MAKDLYKQLQVELMALWEHLKGDHSYLLSKSENEIRRRISTMNQLAEGIGGQAKRDTEELKRDIDRFLSGEIELAEIHRMLEHALKLEQDTREL